MAGSTTGRKAPGDSIPTAGTIKLKKAASKLASPSPSHNGDAKSVSSPTGSPDTALCKHCKKHMPKDQLATHSKPCLRQKQERNRKKKEEKERIERNLNGLKDGDGDIDMVDTRSSAKPAAPPTAPPTEPSEEPTTATKPSNIKKTTGSKDTPAPDSGVKKTKKRKAADDNASVNGDAATSKPQNKKQKKKEATVEPTTGATNGTPTAIGTKQDNKAKTGAKPKGPVDVEKQCGVLLPNGAMCARSLTCKSHAMGAKRAVPGRSLPYDTLLAQYQKKNQAKLHKAALASGAPLAEDADAGQGPVDSDEEREAVMAGIARAAPRQLAERPMISVLQRTKGVRIREMLSQAMAGNRGAGLFAVAPRPVPGQGMRTSGESAVGLEGEESLQFTLPESEGGGGDVRRMSWMQAQQERMQMQLQQGRSGSMSSAIG